MIKITLKFNKAMLQDGAKRLNTHITPNNPCYNCAFHNPKTRYGCEMTEDIPVICSVKMRKIRQEKLEVKNEIQH